MLKDHLEALQRYHSISEDDTNTTLTTLYDRAALHPKVDPQ
jgi:hypothetical protein